MAFDRLWCDRPSGPGSSSPSGTEDGASGDASRLLSNVDGYISNYFRHVAELSRESVYLAHQRAILCRMRDDVAAGDRLDRTGDLEARIEKVELNDRTLRAEIANLMRIAE